jgi:hypothetical protein
MLIFQNMLMTGPPGSGKTLVARAVPSILPRMTFEEALDVTRIYSVADQLPPRRRWCRTVPSARPTTPSRTPGWSAAATCRARVRSPWRTAACSSWMSCPSSACALEMLRQPLEDKVVTLSRASGAAHLPHQFPAHRGDEPLPLRLLRRPGQSLHLLDGHGHQVPEAHLRSLTRPLRHPHRGAARQLREAQRPAPAASHRLPSSSASKPPAKSNASVSRGMALSAAHPRTPSPAMPICARRRCASSASSMRPAAT